MKLEKIPGRPMSKTTMPRLSIRARLMLLALLAVVPLTFDRVRLLEAGRTERIEMTSKDMLDLARHIVETKSGRFEPGKFEDQYETALIDLINQKRAGKPSCRSNGAPCPRWRGIPDPPLRFSAAFQLSAATPDASSAFASHGPSWRAYGLNIECASAGSTLPPLLAFRDWLIEEARRT